MSNEYNVRIKQFIIYDSYSIYSFTRVCVNAFSFSSFFFFFFVFIHPALVTIIVQSSDRRREMNDYSNHK